jgi:hypothetical protein
VLVEHEYARMGKATRGLMRSYIEKITRLSRAQLTRLVPRYTATGRVQVAACRRRRFPQHYRDSSRTSMPETVALFTIGSKVMLSLPCALGFRWENVLVRA